jgi:hypothetical protein
MLERRQPERTTRRPGGGFDDLFAGAATAMATVQSGPYAESIPVADMTVGQIRARYADRFHIVDGMQAVIDGQPADESTVLRAGQALMFMRSGVKGVSSSLRGRWRALVEGAPPAAAAPGLALEGSEIRLTTETGQTHVMPFAAWLELAAPRRPDSCGLAIPPGVRFLFPHARGLIAVYERPPSVYGLDWIRPDSPARFGRQATYRRIGLALPYLVVFAGFHRNPAGRYVLGNRNEAFVSTKALASQDDALCFPPLLNCSRMPRTEGHPLAWICTQYLDPAEARADDGNSGLNAGLRALLHHLLDTGFNYSSEHHELSSWFSETIAARIDPRLASVETWAAASAADPLFVLDVPWLPTGMSVRQIAERMIAAAQGPALRVQTAADAARVILNQAVPAEEDGGDDD